MGNRIEKRVTYLDSIETVTTTHYVRDASGNVMGVYVDSMATELYIYGSSRLGLYAGGRYNGQRSLGEKRYELTNHLGNVLAVISDNIGMNTSDSVWATVVSATNYYPFGLEMEGRTWSDTTSANYRYAFNSKEEDLDGVWGNVAYDYWFRIYDPTIARFKSVDPLTANFAYYSPYQFAGNKPIMFIDLDGAEFQIPTFEKFKYGDNPAVNVVTVVDNSAINVVNGGIGLINSGIYAIHKVFTNPTAIPNEIKSETRALVSETGKYLEGQYDYIAKTVKQQLVDTYKGFKDPETYEAPLE